MHAVADPHDLRAAGPVVQPLVGVNGPTIFTNAGALDRIAHGLPFGPNGGALMPDHGQCSIPQGGPTCDR